MLVKELLGYCSNSVTLFDFIDIAVLSAYNTYFLTEIQQARGPGVDSCLSLTIDYLLFK